MGLHLRLSNHINTLVDSSTADKSSTDSNVNAPSKCIHFAGHYWPKPNPSRHPISTVALIYIILISEHPVATVGISYTLIVDTSIRPGRVQPPTSSQTLSTREPR